MGTNVTLEQYKEIVQSCLNKFSTKKRLGDSNMTAYQDLQCLGSGRKRFSEYDPSSVFKCGDEHKPCKPLYQNFLSCCEKDAKEDDKKSKKSRKSTKASGEKLEQPQEGQEEGMEGGMEEGMDEGMEEGMEEAPEEPEEAPEEPEEAPEEPPEEPQEEDEEEG